MRVFFTILAGMALIGGLAGWLSAAGGVGERRNVNTAWALPEPMPLGDQERTKLLAALMATGHFGLERTPGENITENSDEAFAPRIAGAWIQDGKIAISFSNGEKDYITASVGDSLPGGWVIKDASLDHATVERDGKVIKITVFPYDKPGT